MFRAGLLSAFLLLAIALPASAGETIMENEISLRESEVFDRLVVRFWDQDETQTSDEATDGGSSEPRPPASSSSSSSDPEDPEDDDFWTVVVVRVPPTVTQAVPSAVPVPVELPPLAGLLDEVQRQASGLPVEDTLALLLGDEEEAPAAPASVAAAPASSMEVPTALLVAGAVTATGIAVFFFSGSTGAAGAGLSGSSATGRKVAPVFSPLFTRFEGKKVLEHPNRAQLYTLVATNPGIRLQDLCEQTLLSRTAVAHHMHLLEQQHLIVSKKVGRSRHFYENGGRFEREQKEAYAVLQNDRSRAIARFIQANPGSIQRDLCEALDLRASIAHWHVKRLEEAHLVDPIRQGRTVSYFPAEAMAQVAV